jgi:hypothetical protein
MSEQEPVTATAPGHDYVALNKYDRPLATLDSNPLFAYLDAQTGVAQSEKDRADAVAVGKLVALQRLGAIRLMVGLSTALEKKRAGEKKDWQADIARVEALGIERNDIFTGPLAIGFSKLSAPNAMSAGIDPDTGIPMETMLNWQIHAILFEGKTEPNANNVAFYWHTYRDQKCEQLDITGADQHALVELDDKRWRTGNLPHPPTPAIDALCPRRRGELDSILTEMYEYWMNKKNDALGLYNHVTHAVHTSIPQYAVFVTSDQNFKRYRRVLNKTNWERLQALGFPGHIMEPNGAVAYFLLVTGASLADSDQQH